jgi:hypothetical protein
MEYGIYFNNDSENNTILSALEELENTFFKVVKVKKIQRVMMKIHLMKKLRL